MSELHNEQHQIIERHLKTLIRGLTQKDVTEETYLSYKDLFQIGTTAVSQIRDVLLKFDFSNVKYSTEFRYVSGLVNLIHDINEMEASKTVQQLKNMGCNAALANILDSICRPTLEDYLQYSIYGIKIFESKNLASNQNVKAKLEKWLKNIPSKDLAEIERINILRQRDLENFGKYTPMLYQINIAWISHSPRWSPISWIDNFITEWALYHEIGHHVYRHTFGQIPEQEKQADKYADKIMLNSSRYLFKAARLFKA